MYDNTDLNIIYTNTIKIHYNNNNMCVEKVGITSSFYIIIQCYVRDFYAGQE